MDFDVLNKEPGTITFVEQIPPPPTKRDPLDPAPLLDLFEKYVARIDDMDSQALALQVVDDDSNHIAVEMTNQAKKLVQIIGKKHQKLKAPYLAVTQPLDAFKKKLSDRLQQTQRTINGKIQPYLQKKEQERREAERKAQGAARKEQERLDAIARAEADRLAEEARQKALAEKKTAEEAEAEAQAAAALAEPAPVVVAEMETETKTVTDAGTAKLKYEWAWEIEDFLKLPKEAYQNRCDEVTKALAPWINYQVKAGIHNISGVKVFQTTKIDTRTRR